MSVAPTPTEILRGLVDSILRCDLCPRPATRANTIGGSRWCDEHKPTAREMPWAPWVRAARACLEAPDDAELTRLRVFRERVERVLEVYEHSYDTGSADVAAMVREALAETMPAKGEE